MLVALLIIAFGGVGVAREESDGDREDDDRPEKDSRGRKEEDERMRGNFAEPRLARVDVVDESVRFDLSRQEGKAGERLEIDFLVPSATLSVTYSDENESAGERSGLEARLLALVEYRDENGDRRYNLGEPVVSGYDLGRGRDADDARGTLPDGSWQVSPPRDVAAEGKRGRQVVATASLPQGGTLGLRFLVFGDFVTFSDARLRPTSVKFDVIIDDFPFQAADTDLTLLVMTHSTLRRIHEDLAGDEDAGVFASRSKAAGDLRLGFMWKKNVTVDGTEGDVGTTRFRHVERLENKEGDAVSNSKDFYALSYPRGQHLVHDPELFVAYESNEVDTSVWLGVTAGVAFVLMAVFFINIHAVRRRT